MNVTSFAPNSVRTRALTFDDLSVDRRMWYVFMDRCHASTVENHWILIGNLAFMVDGVGGSYHIDHNIEYIV